LIIWMMEHYKLHFSQDNLFKNLFILLELFLLSVYQEE